MEYVEYVSATQANLEACPPEQNATTVHTFYNLFEIFNVLTPIQKPIMLLAPLFLECRSFQG